MSWAKFSEEESEVVALEMIANGTVDERPHPGLKKDTQLKYPNTHQFRKITDKGSNMKIEEEGMRETSGPIAGDSKAFDDAAEAFMAGGPKGGCGKRPRKTLPEEPKEKTQHQIALENLRAGHRKWEQVKREYQATIKKNTGNEYVSKLVSDLSDLYKKSNKIDSTLITLDEEARDGRILQEADARHVASICEALTGNMASSKVLQKKIFNVTGL